MKNLIEKFPHQFRFLICFLVFYAPFNCSFAFNKASSTNSASSSDENWVFQEEVKGVKIYYQLSICENKSVVYLKFDNTKKHSVQIAWKEVFATKQVPEEREGVRGEKQLILTPGVTSQSDCTAIKIKECVTLAYLALPSYNADIVKFKLKDISVTNPS